MPCSDNGETEYRAGYVHKDTLKAAEGRAMSAEAAVCALIRQLEEDNSIDDVNAFLKAASKAGDINIVKWWEKHQKADLNRLDNLLRGLSDHEKEMLKDLLGSK